jgi:hypothetical protein
MVKSDLQNATATPPERGENDCFDRATKGGDWLTPGSLQLFRWHKLAEGARACASWQSKGSPDAAEALGEPKI